jgi:phosphoglycolate phosphatase-like HAD superfamily hydrolase
MFLDNFTINKENTKAIFFDFDGVILDSVNIKTHTFELLFNNFSEKIVSKILEHHKENGGMSRFEKIKYYFKEYIHHDLTSFEFELYCKKFSELSFDLVCKCNFIFGALEFITENHNQYELHIISATPEDELKKIVQFKDLEKFFLEILGSPKSKNENIELIIKKYNYKRNEIISIGDSKNDYESAKKSKILFIGI